MARNREPAAGMLLLSLMLGVTAVEVSAQQTPGSATPSERAQRDADKVFHWIRIHGDKQRKASREDRDGKPAAVAESKPAPAAAPAPTVAAATAPAPRTAPRAAEAVAT